MQCIISYFQPADVSALRQKAQDLESHDPALIEMIQEHHLQPPKTSGDYHLDYQYFGAYETSVGQTQLIRKLFEDKVAKH